MLHVSDEVYCGVWCACTMCMRERLCALCVCGTFYTVMFGVHVIVLSSGFVWCECV